MMSVCPREVAQPGVGLGEPQRQPAQPCYLPQLPHRPLEKLRRRLIHPHLRAQLVEQAQLLVTLGKLAAEPLQLACRAIAVLRVGIGPEQRRGEAADFAFAHQFAAIHSAERDAEVDAAGIAGVTKLIAFGELRAQQRHDEQRALRPGQVRATPPHAGEVDDV